VFRPSAACGLACGWRGGRIRERDAKVTLAPPFAAGDLGSSRGFERFRRVRSRARLGESHVRPAWRGESGFRSADAAGGQLPSDASGQPDRPEAPLAHREPARVTRPASRAASHEPVGAYPTARCTPLTTAPTADVPQVHLAGTTTNPMSEWRVRPARSARRAVRSLRPKREYPHRRRAEALAPTPGRSCTPPAVCTDASQSARTTRQPAPGLREPCSHRSSS
jgi:hypothetical protein